MLKDIIKKTSVAILLLLFNASITFAQNTNPATVSKLRAVSNATVSKPYGQAKAYLSKNGWIFIKRIPCNNVAEGYIYGKENLQIGLYLNCQSVGDDNALVRGFSQYLPQYDLPPDEEIADLHKKYAPLKGNFGQLKTELGQKGWKPVSSGRCNGRLQPFSYEKGEKRLVAMVFCAGGISNERDIEAIQNGKR